MAKTEAMANPQLKTKLYLMPRAPKSLRAFLVIENQGLRYIEINIVIHPITRASIPKKRIILRNASE